MEAHRAHCLILPFPFQGHINPMLQFSKRLLNEGIKITLAVPKFLFKTIQEVSASISVEMISDGLDEGGSPELYLDTFQRVGPETVSELVSKLQEKGCSVDCIIYDALLPWASDVAIKFSAFGAAFFTQSCAVNTIYYHIHKGLLKLPVVESEVRLPGLPLLAASDLPTLVSDYGSFPAIFQMAVNQFHNIGKANWLFFNSFYELENEGIDWITEILPVKTIGPAVPSMYLDKRLPTDKEYGLNIIQATNDTCITWLDERSEESVVYVSFGSWAELNEEQMEEMAMALKSSNKYFLWVVRKSEENKLPKGFLEETKEKGLVVSWCPQLQVLAHESVACFVTHCGWNSTLEALSSGVPMVAMPHCTDQTTNSKFVMDIWKTGIRVQSDDNGLVRRDVIEKCIRQVMEGERAKEFRTNATKWKELARTAVDEGGSSDKNVKEFVNKLVLK